MFDVAEGDWKTGTLGQYLDRAAGGGTPARDNPEFWGGSIPWVSVKDITKGRELPQETITPEGLSNSSSRLIAAGTNIIATRMAVGSVMRYDVDVAINQDLLALTPSVQLDPDFLYHWLNLNAEKFLAVATGTTVKGIRKDLLLSFSMDVPPLDEQRRIASVLRSVDEAVAASKEAVAQYEVTLQAELDGIFHRYFANSETAICRLGDVSHVKGGKRLPKGAPYEDSPTPYPYIRVTNWCDYEISTDDIRFLSMEIANHIKRYTISSRDIFISIAGSIGLVASVPDVLNGAYLTENAAKIVVDKNVLDTTYLIAALRSAPLQEQISRAKGVGGGVPKLALFRIEDLTIPLLPLEEQLEIAGSYSSIRTACKNARVTSKSLERMRQMMVSDLLSGRVRVPV